MLVYFNEALAKLYFAIAFFYLLFRIFLAPQDKKVVEVLKACAYFVGVEVFFRTTRGALSYETSKYLVILFVLVGMLYKGVSGKAYPYFMYLMFLVPSIFVASTTLSFDANFRTNIAFVLSGPVCLGVASIFFYGKRVSYSEISNVLLYVVLPIIAMTTYLFFYTPSVQDVLSNTASNRATSGGFGANQVATVLGMGMFVMCVRLFVNSPTIFLKLLNAIILILISFRAVVTFSRGGVVAAIIAITAFIVMYYFRVNYKKRGKVLATIIFFMFCSVFTWFLSSDQTAGLIDKRYRNEDVLGRQKKDLTTGRAELFINELEGFIENPFFGIGSSRAKDRRIEIEGQGVTSHSEVSRMLAEHGILGIAMLVILIFKPFDFRTQHHKNYYFYAFLCFWFATINHSSMRIAAPAFIYALTLLDITNEKRSVRRQLLEKQ